LEAGITAAAAPRRERRQVGFAGAGGIPLAAQVTHGFPAAHQALDHQRRNPFVDGVRRQPGWSLVTWLVAVDGQSPAQPALPLPAQGATGRRAIGLGRMVRGRGRATAAVRGPFGARRLLAFQAQDLVAEPLILRTQRGVVRTLIRQQVQQARHQGAEGGIGDGVEVKLGEIVGHTRIVGCARGKESSISVAQGSPPTAANL